MSAESSPPPAARGMDRTARITVGLLFTAWLIDYGDRLVINFVLPDIKAEFGLTHGQLGIAVSIFFVAYALCQIPGGLLADRFGAKRITLWAMLAWSAFTALTGAAWSFAALLALRFFFGIAQGVFPPASTKLLVERTRMEHRMRANGLVLSSNALAAALVPVVMAPLVGAFGWRSAFYSMAALGVFVYVAVRLWLPKPVNESDTAEKVDWGLVRRLLGRWVMWRFALMMFGYGVVLWGLNTWVPSYLNAEHGVAVGSSGLLVAIPAVAAAITTALGGRIADALAGHHRRILVPGMAVSAVALAAMPVWSTLTGFVVLATVAVSGACIGYISILSVPLRSLPPAFVGVGVGVILFGGQFAGMVAPTVMGFLVDAVSFQAAFAFLILGAVLSAAMAVWTPQDAPSFHTAVVGRLVPPPGDEPERTEHR